MAKTKHIKTNADIAAELRLFGYKEASRRLLKADNEANSYRILADKYSEHYQNAVEDKTERTIELMACTDSLVLCKNVYDQMDTSILAHLHCPLCNTHCYHVETL